MKYQTENPSDQMNPAFTGDEIRYIENLNPKKEALTVENLRMFSGCEHYNEQAAEIVKTIHLIVLILYENRRSKNSLLIDNQLVVNLKKEEKLLDNSQLKLKAA